MLVAPIYNGVELPVHDPETFVATAEHMRNPQRFQRDIAYDGAPPAFVRATLLELLDPEHAPPSLAEVLKKTDEELEVVAEMCGALVVRHEWGLYPIKGKGYEHLRYLPSWNGNEGLEGLPVNHILVAEVDLVQDPDPEVTQEAMSRHGEIVRAGLHRYYQGGKGSYQLCDLRYASRYYRTNQFLVGTTASLPDGQSERHLADIEPRFKLTR